MCFAFYKHYHAKPKNYFELFEFCKLKELEGFMEEYMKRLSELK